MGVPAGALGSLSLLCQALARSQGHFPLCSAHAKGQGWSRRSCPWKGLGREGSWSWACWSKFWLSPNSCSPVNQPAPSQTVSHRGNSRERWIQRDMMPSAGPGFGLSAGPYPKESTGSLILRKVEILLLFINYYIVFVICKKTQLLSNPKLPWEAPGSFWGKNNHTSKICRPELATHTHPVHRPSGSFVEPLRGIRLEGLALLSQRKKTCLKNTQTCN